MYKGSTKGSADHTAKETTLDLALTTPRIQVHSCRACPDDVDPTFDHYPVIIDIQSAPVIKLAKQKRYKETEDSWEGFKFLMYHDPINRIINDPPKTKDGLDAVIQELVKAIMDAYETSTPSYMAVVNERHPWITKQLRKEMNSIHTLNRNAKKEKKQSKRRSMYERLSLRKKLLGMSIANHRKQFQKEIVSKCTKDSKQFFSLLNCFKPPAHSVPKG